MRFVGGKYRHAKAIVDAILRETPPGLPWVEPFVGSASVIAHVPPDRFRLGSDGDPYIIALHHAVQRGWRGFENVSEAAWRGVKAHPTWVEPHELAFIGFGCSFGARWFEGYARDPKKATNYAASAKRNLERLAPRIAGVPFVHCDYRRLTLPPGHAIVYADPPYKQSIHDYYPNAGEFSHQEFWTWCQEKARTGYHVYVSEFEGPEDPNICTTTVWEKPRSASLTRDTGAMKRTEKLFCLVP